MAAWKPPGALLLCIALGGLTVTDGPSTTSGVREVRCIDRRAPFAACVQYVRERLDDPELLPRLRALADSRPDDWLAAYLVADWHFRARDHERAESLFLDALRIATATGDESGQVRSHYAWAIVGHRTGGPEEGIRRLRETIARFPDVKDRIVLAWAMKRLADRHRERMDYASEIRVREQLLEFLARHSLPDESPSAYYSLGTALANLGNYPAAIESYERMLEATDDAGDRSRAATAIGILQVDLGLSDEARARFADAVDAAERDGDDELRRIVHVFATLPDLRADGAAAARDRLALLLSESTRRFAANPDSRSRRTALLYNLAFLGEAELALGDDVAAEARFRRVDELAPTVYGEVPHLDALQGLIRLHLARGEFDAALATAGRVESLLESVRSQLDPGWRTRFLHGRADVVQSLARAFAVTSGGDLTSAFATLERGHARALRESLAAAEGAPAVERTLSLEQVRDRLGRGELLVEFMLGERESIALAIDRDGATFHELPPRRELAELVDAYLAVLRRPLTHVDARLDPERDFVTRTHAGNRLRAMLLGSLADRATGAAHLLIVPDRDLHRLPFEALPNGRGGFLGTDVAISYLPAGSFVARRDVDYRDANALFVAVDAALPDHGLPRLEHAVHEIRLASAGWPRGTAERYDDRVPTLDAIVTWLAGSGSRATVAHFASHAVLDGRVGPRVAIGSGTFLDATSLADWKRSPTLVILSACETGRGEVVGGEGVLGLTRAFTAAGTRQVVASLWSVDDRVTATFMAEFHRSLGAGTPPSAALREARRQVLRDGFVHPFYWAPFVLLGADAGPQGQP